MNNDRMPKQRESTGELNSQSVVRRLQLLRAGALQLGIFVEDIATIAGWRKPTPLPQAPESVLGVVSIQGRMLTILDLGVVLRDGSEINVLNLDELFAIAIQGRERRRRRF